MQLKTKLAGFYSKTKKKCNHVEITKTLHKFYESFSQQKETKSKHSPQQIFYGLNLTKLSIDKTKRWNITKEELFETLKSM